MSGNMEVYDKNKVISEIEGFQRASEIKTMMHLRELADRIMLRIGYIDVKCPYCKMKQKSLSYKQKRCIYCGKRFVIFPRDDVCRVADTEHNRKNKHLIFELCALVMKGKRNLI